MSKKPSSLEQLRKVWYKKLEKSGFEDIEQNEYKLKRWSSQFSSQQSINSWEAKQTYYTMAIHFLTEYRFRIPRERNIWEYHANGLSVRDITIILNKLSRSEATKTNRTTVWHIVKKLQKRMYKKYNLNKVEK